MRSTKAFDNSSKIIDTIFTNLPRIPYIDPALDRSSTAHEWLSSADVLRSYESSVAQNNMVEHLRIQRLHIPPSAVAIHLLCHIDTNLGSSLICTTRELNDVRYKLEANNHLIQRFKQNLPPNIRNAAGDDKAITKDFLPYAMWLISAGDGKFSLQRAVTSLGILNDNEKVAFWEHVKRLRALGLTYVKVEGFGNNEEKYWGNHMRKLRLEPAVDQLITFEGDEDQEGKVRNGVKRKEIPSVVSTKISNFSICFSYYDFPHCFNFCTKQLKELLAHEAALEAMRDKDNLSNRNKDSGPSSVEENNLLENKKEDDEKLLALAGDNASKRHFSPMSKNDFKTSETKRLKVGGFMMNRLTWKGASFSNKNCSL